MRPSFVRSSRLGLAVKAFFFSFALFVFSNFHFVNPLQGIEVYLPELRCKLSCSFFIVFPSPLFIPCLRASRLTYPLLLTTCWLMSSSHSLSTSRISKLRCVAHFTSTLPTVIRDCICLYTISSMGS